MKGLVYETSVLDPEEVSAVGTFTQPADICSAQASSWLFQTFLTAALM